MKHRLLFLILFMAAVSGSAWAAEPLLPRFVGEWRSDGDAFGAPAQSRMTWSTGLGAKFFCLDYRIEMEREPGKSSVFQGTAYYKSGGGKPFDAFWADNSGDLHPIRTEREGDALVSHWGLEGHKQGRTRYELQAPDRMEVTDWIRTSEGWRQFNKNVFARVSDKAGACKS